MSRKGKPIVLKLPDTAGSAPARLTTHSTGVKVRTNMRSVALDLGNRISFCEVSDGTVVARATVCDFEHLQRWLGPRTSPARVAVEACREAWWVERKLREWGHVPLVVDTTRCRKLGIGQHGRKTDRIDAETLARAVEAELVPQAHVLSEHRQQLRYQLGVRRALVEARAQYTTNVRGLARAHGKRLGKSSPEGFARIARNTPLEPQLRALIEPLVAMIEALDVHIATADAKLEQLCAREPVIGRLKTVPGVATVVAAAFVAVVDDAARFRKAHEVESYLGLVPKENTSVQRRLGAISKQGNKYARVLLVQAAWAIMRIKDPNEPLKRWALAVMARRGKRVGAVALARRLVGILWAIWSEGTVYEAARVGLASAAGLECHAQSVEVQAAAMRRSARKRRCKLPTITVSDFGHA